ncbi:hypothetical protein BH10CYA1_BH10CYA1_53760 [soil metagenome]
MNEFLLPFTSIEEAYDKLLEDWNRWQTRNAAYKNSRQLSDEFLSLQSMATSLLNRSRMIDIYGRLFVAKCAAAKEASVELEAERNRFEATVDRFFDDSANNSSSQFNPANIRYVSLVQRQLLAGFANQCCVMVSQAMAEVNLAELNTHRNLNPHWTIQQANRDPSFKNNSEIFDGVCHRYRCFFEALLAEMSDPAKVLDWLMNSEQFPRLRLDRGDIAFVEMLKTNSNGKNRES